MQLCAARGDRPPAALKVLFNALVGLWHEREVDSQRPSYWTLDNAGARILLRLKVPGLPPTLLSAYYHLSKHNELWLCS